jgi:membrane-associated protease RseP (regulator of RpoE activity)
MSHEPPAKPPLDTESPLPPDEAVTAAEQMAAPLLPPAPTYIEPAARQTIDEVLLPRPRRRWLMPLVLFLATCFTTFMSGVYQWGGSALWSGQGSAFLTIDESTRHWIDANWHVGLTYMACVMGILLAHEMGHFLMTVRYRVPASYPMFIPFPFLFTGTMGAVIAMDAGRANRRQLFDIGIAGPLAGLAVAVPVLCVGIARGEVGVPGSSLGVIGDPLLSELLLRWIHPDAPPGAEILINPLYQAGWVGMLVTGLNMMPISQLDGGHVLYALLGKRARYFGRAFLIAAISAMILANNYTWSLMVVIVTLIGTDHPKTADDDVPLGLTRTVLGYASFVIPVLCFIPQPGLSN